MDFDPCDELAALCKAGGDPLRLNVLRTLSNDSFGVLELAQIFAIGQSGMSHHLKVLAQAGLVATRPPRRQRDLLPPCATGRPPACGAAGRDRRTAAGGRGAGA
ncbi:hypothetical protein JF55_09160, partial [Pseudomonas sp. 1-7]